MFVAEQFHLFLERRALDILHPDVLFTGGLAETRRVAALADLHYLPVALHNNGAGVTTMAAAQVAAATPNFLGLECHFAAAPWKGALVRRDGPLIAGGVLRLDDRPGLGFDLDLELCAKHLAGGETLPAWLASAQTVSG
jgi:L-alanine-DL-glutamate epimerase-like enolase superfamily enzyme